MLVASAVTIAALVGCGGANNEARRIASKSIVQDPRPLSSFLISDRELAAQPSSGPARVFLRYWSALQYGDFNDAASYYDPALLSSVGVGRVVSALANQAGYFRSAHPQDISVKQEHGHLAVDFLISAVNKNLTPASLSWRQVGGSWKIVYDSALDSYLQQSVQLQVQQQIAPTAQVPVPEALKAGARASLLQARYLEQQGTAAVTSQRR